MALNFNNNLFGENEYTEENKFKDLIQGDTTEFKWIFNNNQTQDTAATAFWKKTDLIRNGAFSNEEYEWVGAEIYMEIFNGSGSNDNFTCNITNETRTTTLLTGDGNINSNETGINKIIIGKEVANGTDELKILISAGVIGTLDGNKYNGTVVFRITNYYDSKGIFITATGGTGAWDTPR